jgi:OOP family OmpA-OmpF porin
MKRNMMFALIALGLGGVGVAQAQESSWYLAPRIGADFPDSKRTTDASLYAGLGLGTWVNPNFAVDFEYGINNADFKDSSPRAGHQWESVQLDVAARWFFGELGTGWRPYVMGGLGALRHKAYSGSVLESFHYSSTGGWDPMATLGVGIQYNMSDRLAFRGEIAARYDHDNNSENSLFDSHGHPINAAAAYGFNRHSGFADGLATVGLVWSFGGGAVEHREERREERHETPPPAPVRETPAPTNVSIDLRGVEFKFDHPKVGEKLVPSLKAPTADSVAILDQAVDTLKRYPNVHVEVDGHTDAIGSEGYNQKLSERRAKGVYDYLTSHGVEAGRLDGPKGFGKTQPIDTNDTAAGRQRNRRVELKVESQ